MGLRLFQQGYYLPSFCWYKKNFCFLFLQVRNEFYKDTQGVILVYDVGQKESFDALDAWLAEMKQELGPHGNMDNIVFVVCANKVGHSREPRMCCKVLSTHCVPSTSQAIELPPKGKYC